MNSPEGSFMHPRIEHQVSINHVNRLTAHFDMAELKSLTQRLVLLRIAYGINDKSRSKQTFTNAYLAELTGCTENNVQTALKGLVDKGLLRASRNRATSSRTIYDLLIDCPSDCITKGHYCTWERQLLNEKAARNGGDNTSEMANREPHSGGSNKDNKENKENKEKNTVNAHSEMSRLRRLIPLETFEEVISEFFNDSLEHRALETNTDTAYAVFLQMVATSPQKISDPLAWVSSIARDNPLRLLAGAPGSTPKQPPKAKLGFEESMTLICQDLGIDYVAEFEGSKRKRPLWELHSKGKLTASAVIASYNSVREPSEKLLASTPSNAY